MVYVDALFRTTPSPNSHSRRIWPYRWACHLFADSEDELLAFAQKIGLQRRWLQHRGLYTVHFDLTVNMRRVAVGRGASSLTWREGVIVRRALREAREATAERRSTPRDGGPIFETFVDVPGDR
jgi:hypothetical protein